MKNQKTLTYLSKIEVISAIIWAGIMLISSYLMKDVEEFKTVLLIMIIAAGFQISLLNDLAKKLKQSLSDSEFI